MEQMRDILRKNLGRSLATMPEADRLQAAWPVACGPALAERGRLTGYQNGVLQVEVQDQAWLAQLQSMAPMLQRELARIARVPLTAIHFNKRIWQQ